MFPRGIKNGIPIVGQKGEVLIRFGVDKSEDGQYEEYNEPTIVKKYDFESGTLTDVVDEKTNAELQETLEGTKKQWKTYATYLLRCLFHVG